VIAATLANTFKARRGYTRFSRLTVRGLGKGMKVEVRCGGRKCPAKRWRVTATGSTVSLSQYHNKKPAPGVCLEVRVTAANMVGKGVQITIR
jgi:hypothetical protein